MALRVCSTPLPRPGFALQGFVPDAQPYALSRAVALLSFTPHRRRRWITTQIVRRQGARLQGVAPGVDPWPTRILHASPARSPLELSPPSGLCSSRPGITFVTPPPSALSCPRRFADARPSRALASLFLPVRGLWPAAPRVDETSSWRVAGEALLVSPPF
jgi:hypothetical protein